MSKKLFLLISDDKLGRKAIREVQKNILPNDNILILIDKSSTMSRVVKLLKKKIIKPSLVFKMFIANLKRESVNIETYSTIPNRDELKFKIEEYKPAYVLMFRAGLIINKALLKTDTQFLNIHASSLPKYGGLGTIQRALDDGAFEQNATLHIVEAKIDSGEELATQAYLMSASNSYSKNENLAYDAGTSLLIKTINNILEQRDSFS